MHFRSMLHLTFDALYGCGGVAAFVILERSFYLSYLSWRARQLARMLGAPIGTAPALDGLKSRDPISRSTLQYAQLLASGASRAQQEDSSSALFIGVDKKVSARLWVLDTIVTAAPLIGLLGTILGIMDTFNALSAGGISDPTEVSRGIGSALRATALGIAAALLGVLGNNLLNRGAHLLMEDFKALLLRLTR